MQVFLAKQNTRKVEIYSVSGIITPIFLVAFPPVP